MDSVFVCENEAGGIRTGVCLAMSMDWIMQSFRDSMHTGKSYVDRREELALGHIGPAQAAYTKDNITDVEHMAWYFHLKVDEKRTSHAIFFKNATITKAVSAVTWLPGFYLLCTVAHATAAAHLLNIAARADEYLFFDPNFGLFRTGNAAEYIAWVTRHLRDWYSTYNLTLYTMERE